MIYHKQIPIIASCIIVLSLISCDILRDGIFEVNKWNPGSGYHDPASVEISLQFSLEPDKNSVERAFSLSENGRALSGHFFWNRRTMNFRPSAPLIANRDYLVTVSTEAQDTRGLNLERQFERSFTTRSNNHRAQLLETVPKDGGIITENRGRIELYFSQPMNRSSLQNISFSPFISGVWALEENGYLAVFTPSENWSYGRSYRLSIGSLTASETEKETGQEYILHFSIGADHTAPELLCAFALDSFGDTAMILSIDTGAVSENTRWERNYRLGLTFSKAVNSSSVSTALTIEPSLGMILETAPGFTDKLVYRFTDEPLYGVSYIITLGTNVSDIYGNAIEQKSVWRIRIDGDASKPPILRGMRFPKSPDTHTELLVYNTENHFADFPVESYNYPFDIGVNTWIELYFETAAGADIDAISLMDRFRFTSTNNAVGFSPRLIVLSAFSVQEPVPGWEDLTRVEIQGVLTNRPNTGMVTIETMAGLRDSLGNRSSETQRFLLLK